MNEVLGDLELIEPIRKTSLGYMWRANLRSARKGPVAATVIGGARDRVVRVEADLRTRVEASQDFRHPFVSRATDLVADGERVALVTDYVEACTLGELIQSEPLSGSAAIEIVRKAARALHAAYDRSPKGRGPYGLVHGEITTDAILISADGSVRILGPFAAPGHALATGDQPTATMAPEAMDGAISHRADVYGLGALLFHALSGGPPPFASSQADWHAAVVAAAGQRVADGLGSDALTRLLTEMLAFDPADRPDASAVEARADKLKAELKGASLEEIAATRVAEVVRQGHTAVLRQMADERDAPPPSVPPQSGGGSDEADDEEAATLRLDPAAVALLAARAEAEAAAVQADPAPLPDATAPVAQAMSLPIQIESGTPPKGARRAKVSRTGKGTKASAPPTAAETAATTPGIPSPAPPVVDVAPAVGAVVPIAAGLPADDASAGASADPQSIPPVQSRPRAADIDDLNPPALMTGEVTVVPNSALDLAEANAASARRIGATAVEDAPPARKRPQSSARPSQPEPPAEDPATDPSFETRSPVAPARTQHASPAAARPAAEAVDDDVEVRQSSGGVTALLIVGVLLIVMAWALWPKADAPADAPVAPTAAIAEPAPPAPIAVPVVAPEPAVAEPFTVEGDSQPTPAGEVLVPVAPGVRAASSPAPAATTATTTPVVPAASTKSAPTASASPATSTAKAPAAAATSTRTATTTATKAQPTSAAPTVASAVKATPAPVAASTASSAATTAPAATAAAPTVDGASSAGSLTVAGDAHSVALIAGGKRYTGGALPAGTYKVLVVYSPNGAEVDGGTARVPAGGTVTVTCRAAFLRCSSR
jgi:trimeric autotransporter adhesin